MGLSRQSELRTALGWDWSITILLYVFFCIISYALLDRLEGPLSYRTGIINMISGSRYVKLPFCSARLFSYVR